MPSNAFQMTITSILSDCSRGISKMSGPPEVVLPDNSRTNSSRSASLRSVVSDVEFDWPRITGMIRSLSLEGLVMLNEPGSRFVNFIKLIRRNARRLVAQLRPPVFVYQLCLTDSFREELRF